MVPRRRRRVPRWFLRIATALVAAWMLYLIAGNAFLHSRHAHDLVNRKPEKFRMDWGGGHTWWPGRVVLHDVRMDGHVRRTLWSVQAERASGRIALLPLLRKQIRVPWVEADGVSGSVARADTELPRPQSSPGGWTLRMDRIASDSITGGDVFGWTITGTGAAEVGFSKQFRGGPAELFLSTARFVDTTASLDGVAWLRDSRVDATFALASHLSADYPGLAKLKLVTAGLDVDGKTVALRSALDGDGHYRFEAMPGEGRIAGELALAGGELAQGGRLRMHTPLHAVDPTGIESVNALDLSLDVSDELRLQAQVPERPTDLSFDLDVRLPGRTLPLQDWRQRLLQATGTARGRWHVPSIAALVRLFAQADWLALEGSGTVEADLRLAQGRLVEGSRLQARDVEAHADVLGNRVSGRAQASAVIEAGEDGHAVSRVHVAMQRFGVAPGGAPSKPYVEGNDLRVDLVSDARLDRMRETSRARIRFTGAHIPDLARFNPYLPNDKLRFGGGRGTLAGDLRVDGAGDVGEGTLRVDGRNARLAVAGIDLRGDVAIDGRLRRGSLERGNFELGGSRVTVRNVAFAERGGAARSGWWATLDLDGGHLTWNRPSSAGGRLRATMKNVDFLLAMFANRTDLPAWIGKVVDAGQASVDGRWQWHGNTLVLDRMHAANDRFRIDARMRLNGNDRVGSLFAAWGKLGVGVELQGDRHQLHLRGAREWYDGQPHLLK
ncbi:MAG: hypothetical protein KIS72_02505 [Luteimonas sp.]|nr:hypothetical protein [Luteimonas sp.]